MTDLLMFRANPFAIDIHRGIKCSSGYAHSVYGGLEKLISNHPDFGADVSEWGEDYHKIAPLFLVRWEDD